MLKTLDIAGADRGGTTFTSQYFLEKQPARVPVEVSIIDPEEGRAQHLAQLWQEAGVKAVPFRRKLETTLSRDVDVRVLAVDDPDTILQTVVRGHQRLLEFGILITSPLTPWGSRVIGVGGTLREGDGAAIEQAHVMTNLIAQLTGGRRPSRHTTAPPANAIQVEETRRLLHQELVRDAHTFLQGRPILSRLFVTETLTRRPPHVYPLLLVESKGHEKRANLRRRAVDAAMEQWGDALSIGFYEPGKPWLYMAFLARNGAWQVRYVTELPASPTQKHTEELMTTQPQPEPEPVYATD